MAQKVRIKRQNVAAFLLNGILHLPSNFKSWNTVHHIPSALKLLSSHCNSRELPRASSLIQLSKNSSDHLKNCWFFPPWTSVLRQKISRLSNYCSINLTAADCPPPTCVSVLQKVISECEAENSFHNKDAISIIICADLCWHIKVSNSINWEALSLALWISHFPKFISIPAAQLISQSNTCSEIVCVETHASQNCSMSFPVSFSFANNRCIGNSSRENIPPGALCCMHTFAHNRV